MRDDLPAPIEQKAPDLLSVISRAAADPAVDVLKMESLLRLQREIMADHAKAEFNMAFTRLADRIPHVPKRGVISIPGKGEYAFARWEDMNKIIQPLLREEGFNITFSSRHENSGMVVVGTLVHRDGHSMISEMWVPPDTAGQGTGRNVLQAMGSGLSYGKRYVTEMLLNIVREGQDDDGTGGPPKLRRGRAPAGFRPRGAEADPAGADEGAAPHVDKALVAQAWLAAGRGMRELEQFCRDLSRADRASIKALVLHELQPHARRVDDDVADDMQRGDNYEYDRQRQEAADIGGEP